MDGRGIAQAQLVAGKGRLAGAGKAVQAVTSVAVPVIGAARGLTAGMGCYGVRRGRGGVVVRAKTDGPPQRDGRHQQEEKQGETFSLERETH
ncbi:hypothetical protein [Geobacter anodireducens]|uniref:hypothetical protein n=1 Tax=Geobacter anodireducens TaxID=1340425 RepID=UPI001864136E|nr:hypothetical protein [Geobacter anodireducens]HMN02437.1 hypothetical protein [Geobacter anodireducens]